ncbi:peptidoglycan-binding domain-containing protein [Galbitalea sp. SE-J8]|uniref:peptidoglycan-binding domain-containing protein n=1 Tax=Galbitalea sp. SE-J8 TaxID=3054952 RepID=UPI00259C9937|nr:peptidoglycan-binding domain-containing protein [Galbitalea sp. SE-J8]MDM4764106.1 peptidoglycan-binding domain-containing protein [Galbitalea sp. SE-J8]
MAWAIALVVAIALAVTGTVLVVRPYATATSHETQPATYVASTGVLDADVPASALVTFLPGPPAVAPVSGTLTSTSIGADGTIDAGHELYAVDLRPVIAAVGSVPAFRTMALGQSGPDIRQLRSMLGLASGTTFDSATAAAVRAWQSKNHVVATGEVELGDVVFLPELPTRGYLAEGMAVGSYVSPGTVVVQTVQARPRVAVSDPDGGLGLQPGMAATLGSGTTAVTGTLGSPQSDSNGGLGYPIETADGTSPCDATCAATFAITIQSQTPVTIQLVPTTTGVLVPESALAVLPDGGYAVVDDTGQRVAVTVDEQANGMAVVDGLADGTTIRLFAEAASG